MRGRIEHIMGWQSFTSQIDQGATTNVAKTVNYSRWKRLESGLFYYEFNYTFTGAGTAGVQITMTWPAAIHDASFAPVAGIGYYTDAAPAAAYEGALLVTSIGRVFIGQGGTNAAVGAVPNLAIANGDTLRGFGQWWTV